MKNDIVLAHELSEVIELRRQLEKRESDLKDLFKVKMNSLGVDTINLGGILISLVEKSRTNLDKKSLVVAFGEDIVAQYEKITTYQQVDVKAVNAGLIKKAA